MGQVTTLLSHLRCTTGEWRRVPIVRIPAALRDFTEGVDELQLGGETVAELLARLTTAHPGLRRQLYTERGGLRSYVNVFVNQDEIRTLAGLQTAVNADDTIYIVPSIAGG